VISNVTFIVITRNEEFAVKKCLSAIAKLHTVDCEVLCVDSDSEDNTIEIMRSFKDKIPNLHIFQIKGSLNSAIGRNVGIRNASRNYLFFIDGDVEIEEYFIEKAISILKKNTTCGAVYGELREYQYTTDYKDIVHKIVSRYGIHKQKRVMFGPGIFMTTKSVVLKTGFFNETYDRNEDTEYTLRLSTSHSILAIPDLMGTHHTISYFNSTRYRNNILKTEGYFLKLVMKSFISNPVGFWQLMTKNAGISYSFFINILFTLSLIYRSPNTMFFLLLTTAADFYFGYKKTKNSTFILQRLHTHYAYPILAFLSLVNIQKNNIFYKVSLVA